ncbi:MAG: BrnT family toxin [Nitrosomonadales bacterium]
MKFTWRESKRNINLKKHGFDFAQSEQVFNGPTITVEDSRDYHGEQRFNTTGFLGITIVTICHTETEFEIHVISMRKAEPNEIDTLSHYL